MATPDAPGPGGAAPNGAAKERPIHIEVRNLTMAFGSFVLIRNLNFKVHRGDIFIIMTVSYICLSGLVFFVRKVNFM